jgi:tetratricopeptide (TPR) repeat protein
VPRAWVNLQNNLGLALERLGEREGETHTLEEAVSAYREALKEATRERSPRQRASIQNNLAFALYRLGEREAGTEKLQEA